MKWNSFCMLNWIVWNRSLFGYNISYSSIFCKYKNGLKCLFIGWCHICCWWLFWPIGSGYCNNNGRNVWTIKGKCWKINLTCSHSMRASWSAYKLSGWPSYVQSFFLTYSLTFIIQMAMCKTWIWPYIQHYLWTLKIYLQIPKQKIDILTLLLDRRLRRDTLIIRSLVLLHNW